MEKSKRPNVAAPHVNSYQRTAARTREPYILRLCYTVDWIRTTVVLNFYRTLGLWVKVCQRVILSDTHAFCRQHASPACLLREQVCSPEPKLEQMRRVVFAFQRKPKLLLVSGGSRLMLSSLHY